MGWRGYADHQRKAVFFWSQKAACTTLWRVLADNMAEPPAQKKYFHQTSQPLADLRPLIDRDGYAAVIVVRHPTIRAISAYFNKFCVYQGRPLSTRRQLEPFARDLHDAYVARTGAYPDANTMSFEDFLTEIEALFADRPGPDVPVNGHWDTQIPPTLARDRSFRYDHVVHVERLETEMAALGRTLGLRYTPQVENRTPVAESDAHDGYLGRVAAQEVSGYAFGYANFLSEETIARIARLYDVDFATFAYRPDPRLRGGPLGPPALSDALRARVGGIFARAR
ncbi:Sulfotransferase family protein [Roseivivax jejudonensis]|uniref:Sulfotransferase family protein n=1 Tax=Roseivivax jejudonensis TaxID=1529041 RepID=A0A1X6ZNC8_9RHOB|nr:sulfotransferase family 2 domain-containing protein [Roseivivax jejudonensis]SLN56800.1 Sulfotransferase family protein [Roseivivax jejudonensis]